MKSVFISYSRRDVGFRDDLLTHLQVLNGLIKTWHDGEIAPGSTWSEIVDQALRTADIILLLVSADFLASEHCRDVELEQALRRWRNKQVDVIAILVRDCDWQASPLAQLQVLPEGGVPIKRSPDPDDAWAAVTRAIRLKATAGLPMDTFQQVPPPGGPPRSPLRPLERSEVRSRSLYLRDTRRHIENLLRESIHNARFLDLGITDTPVATHLPWMYKNPQSARVFSDIEEACRIYDRRLLLLGAPGSGKSTTVLHLALALLREAEKDIAASIPVIVNLSKFRFETAEEPSLLARFLPTPGESTSSDRRFETWLATDLAERPGVSRSHARKWVEEGRIAALLDGLDEVNDERRAELAQLLNTTYLRDHPDSVVVVCSRIDEYRPLQDQKTTRLQLAGAVTLQPLSPEQIDAYLVAARASGLKEALGRDANLYEIAQTPLILSMMTLAYGGLSAEKIPTYALLADQRHHLLESFATRMLQRKERRDRGLPFDDDSDKDVPKEDYHYDPQRTMRYLGWLAVRMSVRMQTACSVRRFPSFLALDGGRGQESADGRILVLSRSALLALCVLAVGLPIVPRRPLGGILGLVVVLSCGLGHFLSSVPFASATARAWQGAAKGIGIPAVVSLGFAAFSQGVAATLPWNLSPLPVGVIAVSIWVSAVFVILSVKVPEWRLALPAGGAIAGVALGVLATHMEWAPWAAESTIAIAMTSCLVVTLSLLALRATESWGFAALLAGGFALFAALQALALWGLGALHWSVAHALAGAVLLIVLGMRKAEIPLLVFTAVAMLGGILSGKEGMSVAVGLALVLLPFWLIWRGEGRSALLRAAEAQAERWILSPMTCLSSAALRRLPWRFGAFLRYCGEALLLKPFKGEIEFAHRRLRDHFALRELVPQLAGGVRPRADVIEDLGFQGVAAVDLLAELISQGQPGEMVTAVRALGRIAARDVAVHMERALQSPVPEVREAVAQSLRHLSADDTLRLVLKAAKDPSLRVQTAALSAAVESSAMLTMVLEEMTREGRIVYSQLRQVGVKLVDRSGRGLQSTVGTIFAPGKIRPTEEVFPVLPASCAPLLTKLLADPLPQARIAACRWMEHDIEIARPELLLLAVKSDPEARVRAAAMRALCRLRAPLAPEGVASALEDSDAGVRAIAADLAGPMSHTGLVARLVVALKDVDPSVRENAAESLGRQADRSALEALVSSLQDEASAVRAAAAAAMRELGDRRAVEPLARALQDKDARVRTVTAAALARWRDSRSVPALCRALRDDVVRVRLFAARALGGLSHKQILKPLVGAMKDRDVGVRRAATASLFRMNEPAAIKALLEALEGKDYEVRLTAASALAASLREQPPQGDNIALDAILSRLEGKRSRGRLAALQVLARFGHPPALGALLKALRDSHWEVRASAAAAIGMLKDPALLPAMTRALADDAPRVREQAARTLGELQDPLMKKALSGVRWDSDWDVREAAEWALQKLLAVEMGARGWPVAALDVPAPDPLVSRRDRIDRALLSRHKNGYPPWIEQNVVIPHARVEDCALTLRITKEEVRARYEVLAAELRLDLDW